jgi:hypothetical protein
LRLKNTIVMKLRIALSLSLAATGALWAAIDQEKKPDVAKADEPAIQPAAEAKPTAEQIDFFEKKIRPVLSEKCYKCHSEKAAKVKGGLVLDTRPGARRGGDSGPAVVPGSLDDSILIEAIRYTNKDFAMPPEKSGGKLPDAVIKDFEAWVKMGAPDPRDGASAVAKKYSKEDAKNWWAFQAPKAQAVPQPKNAAWARGDIDRFLLSALEEKKLKPVGDADYAVLLRRIYFDLTGLPPSPLDVGQFFNDWKAASANPQTAAAQQQAVLGKWVDRLFASSQFGERWGRHWLDVARYAESSGKDVNIAFPNAWRYRDYVIASFNQDKPYDQFLREQLAGDLLPTSSDSQKADHLVATGFLAVGPKGLNEQNPRQFCLDLADEQVDTVSQAMLGLTISCARCHDHKFDPISQREYYGLAGIFLSTDTLYGTASGVQNRHSTELITLPAGAPTDGKTIKPTDRAGMEQRLADLRKEQREFIAARFAAGGRGEQPSGNQIQRVLVLTTQIGSLETQLKNFDENGQAKALAMGVKDLPVAKGSRFGEFLRRGPQGRLGRPQEFAAVGDSALYARGEADKPTEKVPRSFPAVLTPGANVNIPQKESGRRELAEWMTSPSNPLTSRVMVNRIWHTLFGRGIVESVDNFGTTGKKPGNQALLDFLALKFQTPASAGGYGWSVKKLARDIVMSHAYQLSSDYEPAAFAADPENAMLWRVSKRRLDAECIRDAMLSASQQLQLSPPMGSLLSQAGDGPIGGPRFRPGGISEDQLTNSGAATMVRSVYLPIARDVPPDALAVFDFSDASLVTGARDTTNVPAQALFLLNSDMAAAASRKLAERVMSGYPAGPNGGVGANLDQRVALAYWITLGRSLTQNERTAAWNFFQKFPSNWSKGDKSSPGMKDAEDVKAAWTSFCRALFATSDFRYLN